MCESKNVQRVTDLEKDNAKCFFCFLCWSQRLRVQYFLRKPALEAAKNAFHKSVVKHTKKYSLNFRVKFRVLPLLFPPFSLRNFKCLFFELLLRLLDVITQNMN